MHERFTDRARKVMQLADQEASQLQHGHVGTEHVLLALLTEGSGVAASVLRSLGVDVRGLRAEVEKLTPRVAGEQVAQVPLPPPSLLARTLERFSGSREGRRLPQTPQIKTLIEHTYEEARHLNHNYVGTEHLLLGLLRERDGVAAQALLGTGLKLEAAREGVLDLLGGEVRPAHVVVMDALSTVLNAPAELTAEQLQLVRDRVRHLNEQKEVFVAALDFTLAARCRAEAETLTLLLAWYKRHESL